MWKRPTLSTFLSDDELECIQPENCCQADTKVSFPYLPALIFLNPTLVFSS